MTLQHVSIEVRPADAERCAGFWALLGFERVEPPGPLGERSLWVQRDGTQIHLLLREDPVIPPRGHTGVVVDDFEGTLARLREAGFEPEDHPRYWGAPRSFVRDPVGHYVELMAAPPP